MLVLGVLAFCLLMAAASPAFATTRKTRITGLSTSITTVSYRDTGKLTYARSGRYYAVSGQYVKVYRYVAGRWVYVTRAKTSTSGTFPVSASAGYTYKFVFAGVRGRYYSCSWKTKVEPVTTGVDVDPDTLALEGAGGSAAVSGNLWIVSGQTQKPFVDGEVTITRDGSAESVTALADEYGTWTADLSSGDYRVAYAGDRAHRACSATFTVALGAQSELTSARTSYVLEGGATTAQASGLIRTDYGTQGATWTPLGGVTLAICGSDGETVIATVVSDADGAWSADLPLGSYVVKYAGVSGFVAGGGDRYNIASGSCEFAVTLYPTVEAYAEVTGLDTYEAGASAVGTVTLRDNAGVPVPLASPVVLKLLEWSDAVGEEGDYVEIDTVTTDAEGGWSIGGLAESGDYLVRFEEDLDYVVGGTHYHVQLGEWAFLMGSSQVPGE